jgi:hypothetical protein
VLSGFAELYRTLPQRQYGLKMPDKSTRFVFCSSDILFIIPQYCRMIKRKILSPNSQSDSRNATFLDAMSNALCAYASARHRDSGTWASPGSIKTCGNTIGISRHSSLAGRNADAGRAAHEELGEMPDWFIGLYFQSMAYGSFFGRI